MRRPLRFALALALLAGGLALGTPALKGASLPPGGWTFPGVQTEWFGIADDLDGDGNQELILASIDGTAVAAVTPPTPVYIFNVNGTAIVDRSVAFFGTPPLTWMVRTMVTGDFNGDGQRDIYFCTGGREVTDQTLITVPRTPGAFGEQDQVWFGNNGKLVDGTATLPQTVDYSHGCSAGDLDHSGRDSVVINDLGGPFPPYRSSSVIQWDGTQWLIKNPFPVFTGTRTGKAWGFYTATADLDHNGYADVVGDQEVLWGGPSGPEVRTLAPDHLESDTFGAWQGRATADFNGDGYPDLVKILSTKAPALVGARFVLYTGDSHGAFAEKIDAFPAVETYGQTEFGLGASVIDVNFDGFPDLVTFGFAYTNGTSLKTSPTAVWLNDGSGRFTLAHFSDPMVASSTCNGLKGTFKSSYFLKTADPKAYSLILGGCYSGFPNAVYTARTVTPAAPLALTK